jgi:predicted dehydrogenase
MGDPEMKILIVGMGRAGQVHRKICEDLGHTVCGVDANPDLCVGPDYETFRPDRAIIATPMNGHLDWAKRMVEAGVGILVEKPLGLVGDMDAWRQLLIQARRKRVPVWCGYQLRFHTAYRDLERWICAPARRALSVDLEYDYHSATGHIVYEASHEIDLLAHWFGVPDYVVADLGGQEEAGGSGGVCQEAMLLFSWDNGRIMASVRFGSHSTAYRRFAEARALDGVMRVDVRKRESGDHTVTRWGLDATGREEQWSYGDTVLDARRAMIKAFLEARQSMSGLLLTMETLQMCLGAGSHT